MPKTILIADDEPEYVSIIQKRLEPLGFETDEAFCASDVYDKLAKKKFNLLLLDFSMYDGDGKQVCAHVRQDWRYYNLPIIIVTGNSHLDEDYFKSYGATDVIYKPLDLQMMIEKINFYLKYV